MIINSKVVSVFNECLKLSGAINASWGIGPFRNEQVEKASKCTKDIGKTFRPLPLTIYEV